MKQSLEEKLRAASDKARALGRKALKHPVASILSLCVLAICAATLVTFSQDAGKTPIITTAPILPADREITDTTGRKIQVTVLSKDTGSIRIRRTTDGMEFTLPIDKLSAADREWLTGEPAIKEVPIAKPVEKPAPCDITVPLYAGTKKTGTATIRKGETMTVLRETDYGTTIRYMETEVWVPIPQTDKPVTASAVGATDFTREMEPILSAMLMQKRDPIVAGPLMKIAKDDAFQAKRTGPKFVPIMQIIDELQLKPIGTPETVSLRAEFEKLGVKRRVQSGNTCGLYVTWHLFDYESRKGTMAKLPFETLKQIMDAKMARSRAMPLPPGAMALQFRDAYSDGAIIAALHQISGEQGLLRRTRAGQRGNPVPIHTEFIKNELRNGRPVIVTALSFETGGTGPHGRLFIGFKTEDQTSSTTQFETIDSNSKDYTWSNDKFITDAISIEPR